MVDYNKDMEFIYYTQSPDLDIVEFKFSEKHNRRIIDKFVCYFNNIDELADLINTSPRLAGELKELLKGGD